MQILIQVVRLVVLLAAQGFERAEVRLHLVQYPILGALIWAASRLGGWRRALFAVALTAAAGWFDECVQYFTPDRVYDNWDVALNAACGTIGVGVVEISRRLPNREARGGE